MVTLKRTPLGNYDSTDGRWSVTVNNNSRVKGLHPKYHVWDNSKPKGDFYASTLKEVKESIDIIVAKEVH